MFCTTNDHGCKRGNSAAYHWHSPAKVVDDEWGEASGSRIILERGKRIAKVLGDKNQRSRLELPALPNLGFPKDIYNSQKK